MPMPPARPAAFHAHQPCNVIQTVPIIPVLLISTPAGILGIMWAAIFIVLTCVCAVIVIVQIWRTEAPLARDLDMDLDVYRGQLRRIVRDVATGTLAEAEGERSTRDIHRRILAAGRRHDAALIERTVPHFVRWAATVMTVLLLVPGTLLLLPLSGYQHLPDMPVAARIEQAREIRHARPGQAAYIQEFILLNDTQERGLTDEQAALLVASTKDPEALVALAIEQAAQGQYHVATRLQGQAIEHLKHGVDARHHARMAAYLVAEAGGYVSPEAESHLVAALALDPGNVRARYLSGLLDIQTGRPDLGYWQWLGILETIPADDPIGRQIHEALPFAAYAAGIEHLAEHQQDGMRR